MAEEAEEQVEEEAVDPIAQFMAAVESEQAANQETEPPHEGDDDSAEVDAGTEEKTQVEKPAETPTPEGPSVEMQQIASDHGVHAEDIAKARDNRELALLIGAADRIRAAQEPAKKDEPAKEPVKNDLEWNLDLPEDEFGPDDPIRKALASVVEQVKASITKDRRGISALINFAEEHLKEKDEAQKKAEEENKAREAEIVTRLAKPFDQLMNSFNSDVLGKGDFSKLSESQQKVRLDLWDRTVSLGMTPDSPPEEVERLGKLAVEARHREIADQFNKQQRKAKAQPQRVLGGNTNGRAVEPKPGFVEWFEDVQNGRTTLAEN